jgi:N-acetylglutamate synthase-like GNAT family acetyltransferase
MIESVIRQATEADVSSIYQLQKRWAEEKIVYGFVAETEDGIRAALGPYFLVAELDGDIVGFISGSVHLSEGMAVVPKSERYLEIDDLFIAPHVRRNKIGGKLVDRLASIAKRDGIRQVLVYSASKDVDAVLKFYEDHGFKSWYVRLFREL